MVEGTVVWRMKVVIGVMSPFVAVGYNVVVAVVYVLNEVVGD